MPAAAGWLPRPARSSATCVSVWSLRWTAGLPQRPCPTDIVFFAFFLRWIGLVGDAVFLAEIQLQLRHGFGILGGGRIFTGEFTRHLLIVTEDVAAILSAHFEFPGDVIGAGFQNIFIGFARCQVAGKSAPQRHLDLHPLEPDPV